MVVLKHYKHIKPQPDTDTWTVRKEAFKIKIYLTVSVK